MKEGAERLGWHAVHVHDGEDALRLLKMRNWDAVFIENEIPRVDWSRGAFLVSVVGKAKIELLDKTMSIYCRPILFLHWSSLFLLFILLALMGHSANPSLTKDLRVLLLRCGPRYQHTRQTQ
jgi:hypothetical protein